MNLLCRFIGLAIFASANFLPFQHVFAQLPDLSATVQFSNGQTLSIVDFSDSIGVQPGELVNITVQFPAYAAGEAIVVEALDGGSTSVGSSIRVVNDNGTFSFAFVAPATIGTKSLGIWCGSNSFSLQFSVN